MEKPGFVYVTYIGATPEQVWQALTTPEFTRQYWGGRSVESTWTVGAPVRMRTEHGRGDWEGQVLACDPPRLLSYSFFVSLPGEPPQPSTVTFQVKPFGENVQLTVTHEGLEPDGKHWKAISGGWPAILSSLKSLLERGRPLKYDWPG